MGLGLIERAHLENMGNAFRSYLGDKRMETGMGYGPLTQVYKTPNIESLDNYSNLVVNNEMSIIGWIGPFDGASQIKFKITYQIARYTSYSITDYNSGGSIFYKNDDIGDIITEEKIVDNAMYYAWYKRTNDYGNCFGLYIEATPLDADGNPLMGETEITMEVNNTFTPGEMADAIHSVGALTDAVLGGTATEIVNDRITSLPFSCLNGDSKCRRLVCKNVTEIKLADLYDTQIGFAKCVAQEIILPKGKVTGPDSWQNFVYYCDNLKKLDIHSFGPWVCVGQQCPNLETVIIRSTTLVSTELGDHFWNSKIGKGGYIYVPSALISEYENASYWNNFAGSFRAIEDYPDICG